MKIKKKSEQSKKQTKVLSPSTKSKDRKALNVNQSESKLDGTESSTFLQKQPPRLSPRRVASKLLTTPSPSSNNDLNNARRLSSRRRKPSWRVSFDPQDSEQSDGLKVSKEQKTVARKSFSPAQVDLKSIGNKRKQDSVPNRKNDETLSTSRITNGTPVSTPESTESVKSSSNQNNGIVLEDVMITRLVSAPPQSVCESNVKAPVVDNVIILSEGMSAIINGHDKSEKDNTTNVVDTVTSEQQEPKRLKLTNGDAEDEIHSVNKSQNFINVNGTIENAQNEINEEESVIQVQSQSDDFLRKPSLEEFSSPEIDTKFKGCCCNESTAGGTDLRVSKESAAELLEVDDLHDKDYFNISTRDAMGSPFCQAVDLVDSKRFGCIRPATQNLTLYRVSHRTPFRLLCSYHLARLKLHQCCAICGHFCLQGPGVLLCTGNSPSKWTSHLFHRECALEKLENILDEPHELISNIVCPHCGHGGDLNEISVRFQAAQSPVFLPDRPAALRKIALVSIPKSVHIVTSGDHTLRYVEDSTASTLATAMEEAKMLLAESPSFSSANRGENFLRALLDGDIARVMAALLSGDVANTQFNTHRYQSALHLAVLSRNICLIHGLLISGANPNIKDLDGFTPLMLAGKLNEPTLAKYLIAAGAEKFERGFGGMNVVHLSAMAGNLLVLQSILEDHPNLSRTVTDDGLTPLMIAAKFSRTEVVNYLVVYWSGEINIRALDKELNTALHWAAASGAVQAVSILIQNGANVNAVNRRGQTPLHWSISNCRDGCVLALLVNHANLSVADSEGKTPLDLCTGEMETKLDEYSNIETNRAKQTIKSCIMQTSTLRSQISMMAHEDNHRRRRIVSNDISCGKEPHRAIQCINEVDDENLPEDFTYITTTVFRAGSSLTPPMISSSKTLKCNCQSDILHNNGFQKFENMNKEKSRKSSKNSVVPFVCSKDCLCSQNGVAYDARGRLFSQVLNYLNATQLPTIQECNQLCKCDTRICRNRVIQQGMTCDLQVFRKYNKKWGVKAIVQIPRGSFVCTCTGEIVTTFQYSSSWNKESNTNVIELYDHILLDSSKFGNVSRFMNHSCSPNVVPVKALIEHDDERFPHIAFFSIRDIEINEELCYDYGEKFWELKTSNGFTCDCESERCRYAQPQSDEVDLGLINL